MAGHAQRMGLVEAISIGIGGMVGGGIFAVLGVAATSARGATPIAFAIGGLIAALTASSYSRLSVRYPGGGGTVTILDRTFCRAAITGGVNVVLWAGYVATTALYATAFANYVAALFTGGAPGPVAFRLLVAAGIGVPWLINLAEASLVARTEGLVVAVKLAILVAVVIAGAAGVDASRLAPTAWPAFGDVLASAMLVFVAYEGFELIANAAEDIARPRRNLPLAFGLAVGIVIVLYVAIATVVVGTMSASAIAGAADFALAEAANGALGRLGFTLVALSAVLATFSAINATLYGTARLSWSIAAEGELPRAIERRAWNQPIGLHITAAASLLLGISLGLTAISAICSAIFLVVFGMVNLAGAREPGPVPARLASAAGALGCAISLVVLLTSTAGRDPVAVIGLVALLVIAIAGERWWLRPRRPRARPTGPAG